MLDKAALVLSALESGPATLDQLVAATGLPDPPRTGSLSRSSTTAWSPATRQGRFVLGPRLDELAAAAVEDRLLAAAGPVLARLRDI